MRQPGLSAQNPLLMTLKVSFDSVMVVVVVAAMVVIMVVVLVLLQGLGVAVVAWLPLLTITPSSQMVR